MSIVRELPAQGFDNFYLPKGIVQMVVAADNMGYPHVIIINNHRQHISRTAIPPQHHKVIKGFIANRHIALNTIGNGRIASLRHFKANCKWPVRGGGRACIPPRANDFGIISAGFIAHRR